MIARRSMRGLIALGTASVLLMAAGCTGQRQATTAYASELQMIARESARLEMRGNRLGLVRQHYLRAVLSPDFLDLAAAERAVDAAISDLGPIGDLLLAKASLQMKLHRLDAALETLDRAPYLRETPGGRSLLVDVALQQGRYVEAGVGLEANVNERSDWEDLARLAYFRSMTGEAERADRLYARAQERLTAKEMRHYAWLELQRGIIDLNGGRYEAALAHYRHADRAYSGYWLIEEHVAEVLNLLGRSEESAEIYARVVRSSNRPELLGAYARVIADRDPERSMAFARAAGEAFERQMALYPQAAVGHYLGYLMDTDTKPDTNRLIELARMNMAERPNAESKLMLARAYLKAGMVEEARPLIAEAEATPWRPPR